MFSGLKDNRSEIFINGFEAGQVVSIDNRHFIRRTVEIWVPAFKFEDVPPQPRIEDSRAVFRATGFVTVLCNQKILCRAAQNSRYQQRAGSGTAENKNRGLGHFQAFYQIQFAPFSHNEI